MSSVGPEKSACPGPVVRSRQDGTKNQNGERGGEMKRTVLVFLFAVLVAVFGFQVRSADAYSTVTTCAGCHTFGGSGSTFHQGHLNLGLPNSCQTCHVQTGDIPATTRCGVSHVTPGLPLPHGNA